MTEKIRFPTIADLLNRLGQIPPERIRCQPLPGTARQKDLLNFQKKNDLLFELIDGTLVGKAMGLRESFIAMFIAFELKKYLEAHDLGEVSGADGFVQLREDLIRSPDVGFFSWDRLGSISLDDEPFPKIVPDLAIEIISRSNTRAEMLRKVAEFLQAGTKLIWIVNPETKTVEVHQPDTEPVTLGTRQKLTCPDILPGFTLRVAALFQQKKPRKKSPDSGS